MVETTQTTDLGRVGQPVEPMGGPVIEVAELARLLQPGHRQVMSRHRTNSSSAVEGRYPGSGALFGPGWRTGLTVAPALINSASSAAGMSGPPSSSAGGVLTGGSGSGVGSAAARKFLGSTGGGGGSSPLRCASAGVSMLSGWASV